MPSVKYISHILKTTNSIIDIEKVILSKYIYILNNLKSTIASNQYDEDEINPLTQDANTNTNIEEQLNNCIASTQDYYTALFSYTSTIKFENESTVRQNIISYRQEFYNNLIKLILSFANIQLGSLYLDMTTSTTDLIQILENYLSSAEIIYVRDEIIVPLNDDSIVEDDADSLAYFSYFDIKEQNQYLLFFEMNGYIFQNVQNILDNIIINLDLQNIFTQDLHTIYVPNILEKISNQTLLFEQLIIEIKEMISNINNPSTIEVGSLYTTKSIYLIYESCRNIYNLFLEIENFHNFLLNSN
mgnify:CR=1 FL=1